MRYGKLSILLPVLMLIRNLALGQAETDLVFLVVRTIVLPVTNNCSQDVDFIPSAGIHQDLQSRCLSGENSAFVVPAFELLSDAVAMPTHANQLQAMYMEKTISGFHTNHFPKGHMPTGKKFPHPRNCFSQPTNKFALKKYFPEQIHLKKYFSYILDYNRYFSAQQPYEVSYVEGFEPYIVAERSSVPEYDERFRGYGMNKISHLYHISKKGFKFIVLPHVFVIAAQHAPSKSWERTFGANAVSN
jgi:glycosyltransferase-like protein LARGE